MKGDKMSDVKNYLDTVSLMIRSNDQMMKQRQEMKYSSMEHFFSELGQQFTAPSRPLTAYDIPLGEKKQCYKNCMDFVMNNPDTELLYCEGFALGCIPIAHAWLSTPQGEVFDPTWGKSYCTDYFGVAFDRSWAISLLLDKGSYGLVDDWEHKWPLLSHGYELEWKVKVKNDDSRTRLV
tara:strand:- start:169 stop:705 length:537 start_codon:yes stop_codon:yes gene_type:complete